MINYDVIGRALIHPVQQEILEQMERLHHHDDRDPGGVGVSPNELAQLTGKALGTVSYHVKVLAGLDGDSRNKSRLADTPMLELSHTEPRRGAVEHFYCLASAATVREPVSA